MDSKLGRKHIIWGPLSDLEEKSGESEFTKKQTSESDCKQLLGETEVEQAARKLGKMIEN